MDTIKCISFSLYGQNPKYLVGALENVKLAQQHFPNFICYIFHDQTIPQTYIERLSNFANVKMVDMKGANIPPMMWRFTAIDLPGVGLMLSRDADSRLSYREKTIIAQWEAENNAFLMIKDHPGSHGNPFLMGGLWGMKKIEKLNITALIADWLKEQNGSDVSAWGADQRFLMDKVYPSTIANLSYYDDYNINKVNYCKKINFARENWHFIGEIFNAENQRDYHWKALRGHHLRSYGPLGYVVAKIVNIFSPEWR